MPSAFLHPFSPPAREEFVTIVRGEGAAVFDQDGRRYVDAMASLWYCNVGHGREEMTEAVAGQMRTLEAFHCFDPFTNEPADRLAAEIAELAPLDGARVFFTTSGSEAVDTALKLARLARHLRGEPERQIVATRGQAYHGVTYGGLSAQGLPANQDGFGALVPGFVVLPQHDLEAAATLFSERGDEITAVITEPVQGAGGVHPPGPGYLEGLRRLCDDHGAWLIFDEVICGFGRLGHWWGADRYGVQPDLITFAKGVTSGYLPLGGVVVSAEICSILESDPAFVLRHGHTYSGHPTCCAAALASIGLTRDESLLDRARAIGDRLGSGLRALAADGLVAEARGEGAVWAVDMPDGTEAAAVRDHMREQGVICRAIPPAIAFCPPLVIDDGDLDRIVDTLSDALGATDS